MSVSMGLIAVFLVLVVLLTLVSIMFVRQENNMNALGLKHVEVQQLQTSTVIDLKDMRQSLETILFSHQKHVQDLLENPQRIIDLAQVTKNNLTKIDSAKAIEFVSNETHQIRESLRKLALYPQYFHGFRNKLNHPDLTMVLEGCEKSDGPLYWQLLTEYCDRFQLDLNWTQLQQLDRLGEPVHMQTFSVLRTQEIVEFTPEMLRSLCLSLMVLTKQSIVAKGNRPIHILEVGGGYGYGLQALLLLYLAPLLSVSIESYVILDYPEFLALQEYYLQHQLAQINIPINIVKLLDIEDGSFRDKVDSDLFLFSDLAYSRLSKFDCEVYLTGKIQSGFVVWDNRGRRDVERLFATIRRSVAEVGMTQQYPLTHDDQVMYWF